MSKVRTGKPNGRPAASTEGKTAIDVNFRDVPIDVIQKLDTFRSGNETRKDALVKIVRAYTE